MGDRNQNVFVVFTKTLNLFIWSIVYLLGTQPEQWLYHQHILWLRCNHVGKVGGCNLPTDTLSVHKCIRWYQDRYFQGSLLSNFSGQILRGDHKRYVLEKPTHACLLLPSTLLSFQQKNCIIQFMYNDTQIRLVKVVAHPGSTLNIDLILWHTQLIVYKVKC